VGTDIITMVIITITTVTTKLVLSLERGDFAEVVLREEVADGSSIPRRSL
jgi:hypothetical protein